MGDDALGLHHVAQRPARDDGIEGVAGYERQALGTGAIHHCGIALVQHPRLDYPVAVHGTIAGFEAQFLARFQAFQKSEVGVAVTDRKSVV